MKSALLTGVSGGIGTALVSELLTRGWDVYGLDPVPFANPQLLGRFWQGSAADERLWAEEIRPALSQDESLRAFVHVAAIQPCIPIIDTSGEEWDQVLAVNLKGAFLGTRYLAPLMRDRGGAIVNVASVHALATSPGMAAYVASKGGLVAFTRAAALELADFGIRVNAVLPGAVDTTMLSAGLARSSTNSDDARARIVNFTPLHRVAAPTEIARAIAFLLDADESSFVTGQALVVDGGASIRLATE